MEEIQPTSCESAYEMSGVRTLNPEGEGECMQYHGIKSSRTSWH